MFGLREQRSRCCTGRKRVGKTIGMPAWKMERFDKGEEDDFSVANLEQMRTGDLQM